MSEDRGNGRGAEVLKCRHRNYGKAVRRGNGNQEDVSREKRRERERIRKNKEKIGFC